MGLLYLFRQDKVHKWFLTEKKSEKAINDLKAYLDRYLEKIEHYQFIILKMQDFVNGHVFEPEETRFLSSGYAHSPSPKLFTQYFKIIRTRIRKIRQLVSKEFCSDKKEEDELKFIHKELQEILAGSHELSSEIKDIESYKKGFHNLEHNLREQYRTISMIQDKFKRFVGDEVQWELSYAANVRKYKNTDLYKETLRDKQKIIAEWREFKKLIQESFLNLLQDETKILLGHDLPDAVAGWKAFISMRIRSIELFKDLNNVLKKSSRIVALSKRKQIWLYHATERTDDIFSLNEHKFPSGFYVCNTNKKYARKIKEDQSSDKGASIRIVQFKIPRLVFRQLFIWDNNTGRDGDTLSIEAYDHSFFIPASRYPVFNHYYNEGLIEKKL